MMNNKDRIDDLFRENLDGYRVEPSQGTWENIERRFFSLPGNRRNFLLATLLILLLAGSAVVTWWALPANAPASADAVNAASTQTTVAPGMASDNPEMASHDNLSPSLSETASSQVASNFDEMASQAETLSQKASEIQPSSQLKNEPGTSNPGFGQPAKASPENISALSEVFYMLNLPADLYWKGGLAMDSPEARPLDLKLPLYKGLKDIYAPKYELYAGASFMPSVIFYDPNPNNNGWGAAADIQYRRDKLNLYLGAGVSRFKDKGSWQVFYNSYDSVGYYTNITSFRIDPEDPGKVIFETKQETVYDSVPHVSITEKTNTYTYLDIPLGVGLTFLEKRRVSMTLKTGIRFSLLLAKDEPTAGITMPEASEISIIREVPPRMNTAWRYTASLEMAFLITDRWHVYLEPAFEQYLNSVYTSNETYEAKKPYIIGVNAGVRWRIK